MMELSKLKEDLVKEFNELQQRLLGLQQEISQIETRKQRILGQLELIDKLEKNENKKENTGGVS